MLDSDLVEEIDRRAVPGMAYPIAAVISPHQSYASLIIGGKRSPVGPLPPRLIAKADAFALGPAGAGHQKAPTRSDILTATRECTSEREAETPPIRIGLAQIAPLSTPRVLLRQGIQYNLAGWILRVRLHRIDADLTVPAGTVSEHQPDTGKLVLGEHPAISQGNSERSPFDLDVSHCCLRDRLRWRPADKQRGNYREAIRRASDQRTG